MGTQVTSSMPQTLFTGVNDISTRAVTQAPINRPTFLPKWWFFAQQGPSGARQVDGTAANALYGADSFDPTKPYVNHATAHASEVFRQGGQNVMERLIPEDALPEAGLRLSLDVLGLVKVPVLQRNPDGSLATDAQGDPIATGQVIDGYLVKWVMGSLLDVHSASTFGNGTITQGNQTDATSSKQSQRYPIMDIKASWIGKYGQNLAIRPYAPTVNSASQVDVNLLQNAGIYPFRMMFLQRTSPLVSPSIVMSQLGASFVTFGLKPGAIDDTTGQQYYGGDVILPAYQSAANGGTPAQYGPFGGIHFYQDNIDTLLAEFFAAEQPFTDGFSDFSATDSVDAKKYLFNILSGVATSGVKYHAFQFNTSDVDAVNLNEVSTLYAQDGSDGTMTLAAYDAAVNQALLEYGDVNSQVQDTALNPESMIWDPGFSVATKKTMGNVIGIRKNTYIVGNTHVAGSPALTVDQELSTGLAIYAAWSSFIESEEFGTPTTRASIFAQSMTLISSLYTQRVPVSFEVLSKSAAYMGAGNRVWNSQLAFDTANTEPGSILELGTNINVPFIPFSGRQQFWNGKINYVQPFDNTRFFFPALRTVVVNDTSVNTSYFNGLILCELETIGEQAWRLFTGNVKLSGGQVVQGVEDYVNNTVAAQNNFDGRALIRPTATISGADAQRGYSWTLKILAGLNNMMTVETLEIDTDRLAAVQQAGTAASGATAS